MTAPYPSRFSAQGGVSVYLAQCLALGKHLVNIIVTDDQVIARSLTKQDDELVSVTLRICVYLSFLAPQLTCMEVGRL